MRVQSSPPENQDDPSDQASRALHVTISGDPIPWARHRGSGKSATEPPRQKAFRRTIGQVVSFSGGQRLFGFERYALKVVAYTRPSKEILSLNSDAIAAETMLDLTRPDLDNWIKLPLDALTGIVWSDDNLVYSFDGSRRFYSLSPRLELTIVAEGDQVERRF